MTTFRMLFSALALASGLFSINAMAVEVGESSMLSCRTTSSGDYAFSAEWSEDGDTIIITGPVLAGTYIDPTDNPDGSETFHGATVNIRITLPLVNHKLNGSWAKGSDSGYFRCVHTNPH